MRNLLALLLFVPSLCLAQVPDYVPTEGLIAWYNLDGNATDLSDNQLNGTVNGPSTTDDRFGLQGAAHFDGANDYILVPHNDLLNFSNNSMTVSMWVRISALPTGTKEFQTLMKVNGWSHSTVGYQAVIAWNGITSLRAKNGSASTWMESANIASWDLGTYTHITYSLTDTLCSTYINGELASSEVPTNTIIGTNQEPLILGWNNPLANTGASVAFSGDMDDVGFWDRALTAEEVQTLFLNSEPISGCTDSLACNFQADANVDDGSCVSCEVLASACGEGTVWDTTLLACVGVSAPADTVFIEPEACAPSCGPGTVWDPVNEECIIAIPADLNYDGCVSVNDLLILLAVHGTCPPYPEWPDEPTDTTWTCGEPLNYWDYDYATVLIGDQCWFAENLRTMEYSNGDTIPEVTDGSIWVSLNTDARCVFGNDENLVDTHGRLYNWHAVDDARGLCPADWHVPTDGEWTELEDYITSQGFDGTEGTVLKSEIGWQQNGNGSNDFGFSARPCGTRNHIFGNFNHGGYRGYWWSSSFGTGSERFLVFNQSVILQTGGAARHGYSVRCLKD